MRIWRTIKTALLYGVLGLGTSVIIAWGVVLIPLGVGRAEFKYFDAPSNDRAWAGCIELGKVQRTGFVRRYFGYGRDYGATRWRDFERNRLKSGWSDFIDSQSPTPTMGLINARSAFNPPKTAAEAAQVIGHFPPPSRAPALSIESETQGMLRWGRLKEWARSRDWQLLESQPQGLEDAAGWPFPALWCAYDAPMGWEPVPSALIPVYGVQIDAGRRPSVVSTVSALPFHPLWGGLAINMLFWGSLWFAGVSGVAAAKRGWRRRRQRCVGCGYDLLGAVSTRCPECGRER